MQSRRRPVHRARSPITHPCQLEPLESRQLLSTSVPNIMPLGDSITQAFTGHASYRYWLWNSLADAGYVVDFVGSQTPPGVADGPPLFPGFDVNHEGHSGFRADDILSMIESSQWKDFTVQPQNKPDIVLLHIGSNDVEQGESAVSTRKQIGKIINDLRVINPNVTILLAKVIPDADASVTALNTEIATVVTNKNTAQSPVILVDQFSGFDAVADTYDGIHPSESGEKKIANKWLAALTPLLPAPTAPAEGVYLDSTAVPLTNAINAVGPAEFEKANGGDDTSDGQMLSLRGTNFMRGFGVHAPSELDFNLSGGSYSNFRATIGVDDEVEGGGTVVFQVFVNNEANPRYSSPTLTGADAAVNIDVDISGATSLRLVATDGGDDNDSDHADWALARLIVAPVQPPQPQPQPQPPSDDAPSAPQRLDARFHGQQVDLSWQDASSNELGFRVFRRDNPSGLWHQIAELSAHSQTFTDTHLIAGSNFAYRIVAFNDGGASDPSNVANAFIPPRSPGENDHDLNEQIKKQQEKAREAAHKAQEAAKKALKKQAEKDREAAHKAKEAGKKTLEVAKKALKKQAETARKAAHEAQEAAKKALEAMGN